MSDIKKISGAAVTEKEYKRLLADQAREKVYKQREEMLKELVKSSSFTLLKLIKVCITLSNLLFIRRAILIKVRYPTAIK